MYSEKEDAEKIINNGFTDGYRYREALAVAKYYRHILNCGDGRVKSRLIEFCQTDKFFYPVRKRKTIQKIVRESRKPFLDTSNSIIITKKEIESIRSIHNFRFQLILLALLAIAKLKKREEVWLGEWRYVRKIISRYISNRNIISCITFAYENKLIDEPIRDNHFLTYIEVSSEPVITLNNDKDLFNLENLYKSLVGGEIIYCKQCDNEIIRNGRRHKYCDNCWRGKEKMRSKLNYTVYGVKI